MKTINIKTGLFNPSYPIDKLRMSSLNRDMHETHINNFSTKLIDYGWMMPIVISKSGDVLEGHHRIKSAKLLKQKTIPAYIVNWVNTKEAKEHLDCIISLNNGNKAWSMFDYLKAFAKHNKDYKTVYDAYISNSNNVSVGNVINVFFRQSNKEFKKGNAIIEDINFSKYLLHNLSYLYEKYGKKKITAYCVREFINVAFNKANKDKGAVKYLFKQYEKMAKTGHLAVSSIMDFRPILELDLNYYQKLKNDI